MSQLVHCFQIRLIETCLARVLVRQVERVAGERHTTGLLPLDEGGAGAACILISVAAQFSNSACFRAALTGNFPDQVGREGGHFVGICGGYVVFSENHVEGRAALVKQVQKFA